MTKDQARQILENWINDQTKQQFGEHQNILLPITDEVIMTISSPDAKIATTLKEQDDLNNRPLNIEQWSFKGLIKIAYDL